MVNVVLFDRYGDQRFSSIWVEDAQAEQIAGDERRPQPAEFAGGPGEYGAQGWTGLTFYPTQVREALEEPVAFRNAEYEAHCQWVARAEAIQAQWRNNGVSR